MRSSWQGESSWQGAVSLHGQGVGRVKRRALDQLMRKVLFQFSHETLGMLRRIKAPPQAHPVMDRHRRLAERRPAFAQIRRIGFYQNRLHRHLRMMRNQADTALERIDRGSDGTG